IRHKSITPDSIIFFDDTIFLTDIAGPQMYDTRRASTTTIRTYKPYGVKYSSPEVMSGERRSSSADIFQLGAVFSEMTTVISKRSLRQFEQFRGNASSQSETRNTNGG